MEDKNRDQKKKKKNPGTKLKKLTNMVDVIPTVLIKTLKHQKKKKEMLQKCCYCI